MSIPLIDLKAQYRAIRTEVDHAIRRVLSRGQFILGPEGEALERDVAADCGAAQGVGLASGTDALELSLRACGVGPGDEVITTALSFVATASAIAALGARPVFVDVDPVTCTLQPAQVQAAITRRTKAIVPVHLYGQPCDMGALTALAQRRAIPLIEDCAQAIGAKYRGQRVGSFGRAAAISFYPSKNLGAYGDGGMVVTSDAKLAEAIRQLRIHGSRDRVRHDAVSRNSRLDELQAAILRVKLRRLDAWNAARRTRAHAYRAALTAHALDGVLLPQERPDRSHVYHVYAIRVPRRDAVRQSLTRQGIGTQVHYEIPLHLEPCFASLGYRRGAFPIAERIADEVLSLPMYPELTDGAIARVASAVAQAIGTPRRSRTRAKKSSLTA